MEPLLPDTEQAGVAQESSVPSTVWRFIIDAPFLTGGAVLAEAFATIQPWPHQTGVAEEIVHNFPRRYLLCDEVGLGKTIEVGLALKKLLLTGTVRRCLILTPKGINRQWQEELYEKFNISALRYTGSEFVDYFHRTHPAGRGNPWDAHPLVLGSSHLVKRDERRQELLDAAPWDLVILDEAHHARRITPTSRTYRPNNLLQLLSALEERTWGLLLLTATPMQLDPVELWDLLIILGMGGLWGTNADRFKNYFLQLRSFPPDGDGQLLLDMLRNYLQNGGRIPPDLVEQAQRETGPDGWGRIEALIEGRVSIRRLDAKEQTVLQSILAAATPVDRFMFHHTRRQLRTYREQGLLQDNVPERDVEDIFIELTPGEVETYNRLEEYIRHHYRQAIEEKKSVLGFITSIYRRRLTSSAMAIRLTLERRLEILEGVAGSLWAESDGDFDPDFGDRIDEADPMALRALLSPEALHRNESAYLQEFIVMLDRTTTDSKFTRLSRDLQTHLGSAGQHEKVIIFTQYTDTMDYLREKLRILYGRRTACYSGRGGEVDEAGTWGSITKEQIKERFARGEITVLICTDAASEGLNLQTCGLLINYDMPWNPMRVEQRIGRIDRIGQVHSRVQILNYFYRGTVEEKVYVRLAHRIGLFRAVVGEHQPILARVEEIIRKTSLAPPNVAEAALEQALRELDEDLNQAQPANWIRESTPDREQVAQPVPEPPLDHRELEALFVGDGALGRTAAIIAGPEEGVYQLREHDRWNDYLITFRPDVFDRRPNSVRLFAPGDRIFEKLLGRLAGRYEPGLTRIAPNILRIVSQKEPLVVGYFHVNAQGDWREIHTLARLQQLLTELQSEPSEETYARITKELTVHLEQRRLEGEKKRQSIIRTRLSGRLAAIGARAAEILLDLLCLDGARYDTLNGERVLRKHLQNGTPPYQVLASISGTTPEAVRLLPPDKVRNRREKPRQAGQITKSLHKRAETIIAEYRALEQTLKRRTFDANSK